MYSETWFAVTFMDHHILTLLYLFLDLNHFFSHPVDRYALGENFML